MALRLILAYVVFLFPISEIFLFFFKRSDKSFSTKTDRGSFRLLLTTIIISISFSVYLTRYPIAVFQLPRIIIVEISLLFLLIGIIIRWTAIISLGKFFTVDVAILDDHTLVQRGLYKYIRHPSYTGLLLEFIGLAIYFGTWISLIIIMVPITSALLYRIKCEEAALIKNFGKQYEDYKAQTKSLIPRVL